MNEYSLHQSLERFGQQHLLRFWTQINRTEQERLVAQIAGIDFAELARLFAHGYRRQPSIVVRYTMDVIELPASAAARARATRPRWAPQRSKPNVGVLLDRRTRKPAGFEQGACINRPRERSIVVSNLRGKIRARPDAGRPTPWYIMTGPAGHLRKPRPTFASPVGLASIKTDSLLRSGTMPAVDHQTGQILRR